MHDAMHIVHKFVSPFQVGKQWTFRMYMDMDPFVE